MAKAFSVTEILSVLCSMFGYGQTPEHKEVMQRADGIREKTREYFGFGTKRMKEIKVCDLCGTAVSANRWFCPNCHAKLPHKTLYDLYKSNHRVCSNCGIVLSENAEYCPQCGEKQGKPPKMPKG